MASLNLLSTTSRVETPFVSVKVGNYELGVFNKETGNAIYTGSMKYYYPNYIDNLTVTKINGTVNQYTLNLKYQITAGDDPNFIDKVFSSVSQSRRMVISYGDYSLPSFMYKEEACTITSIKSKVDFKGSSISYTVNAVSDAISLTAGTYTFPAKTCQPSQQIYNILFNKTYGLQDIFYGMHDKALVIQKELIADNDTVVSLSRKVNVTILEYLNYLVSCMIPNGSGSFITNGKYVLTVVDDMTGEMGGPYFTVKEAKSSTKSVNSLDTYEVDIGFPGNDVVTSFEINDDESYSILYNYSKKVNQTDFVYRINNEGSVDQIYSPLLTANQTNFSMGADDQTWWTQVTQYPITATLTIKGLLRASMLMTYIKVNCYFYGRKHISSGMYIITKQEDNVGKSGFRTTLTLKRISGDS